MSERALENKIQSLEKQIKQLEDADALNDVLFEISNAVNTTPNLQDLYYSIHKALEKVIVVPNIYISTYDRPSGRIHFPYYVDEKDDATHWEFRVFDKKSLTGKVILSRGPLFLKTDELKKLAQKGDIVGSLPQIWLGVPLITDNLVIGVMAIQSYTDPNAYNQKDLDLLISTSHQIAVAIERKRINDALAENEKRYRTLSEGSHDIIMRFDRRYRHIYVNKAIHQTGMNPEDIIGKTHSELGFPDDLSGLLQEAIQTVFDSRAVNRIEFQLPKGMWIDWMLSPEFSSRNEVKAVITFARDITERKLIEIQNRCFDRINHIIISSTDMEQMLHGILDTMLEVFKCDRSYILFPCDPAAEKYHVPFLRFRPEWALTPGHEVEIDDHGRKIMAEVITSDEPLVYDPVSKRPVRDHIRQTYSIQSQMVMAVFPKTGQAWEVGLHQCSYERIWSNEDKHLFSGICQRIADGLSNMQLFRKVQQVNKYIDSVFNSMPSILMGVDSDGRVTHWNRMARVETGITTREAVGSYFYDCFPHLKQFKNTVAKAIEQQVVIEKIKIPRTIDNRTVYENITIYPLTGKEVNGAVIRIDDATTQIQMEEMMIQSEKMLSVGGTGRWHGP
jgi:PAS domain S-box-containing protein